MNTESLATSSFDLSRPVVVLAGGPSEEREISLKSGNAVAEALGAAGVDVRLVDPVDSLILSMSFRDREVAFVSLHGTYGEDGICQGELKRRGIPFTGTQDPPRLATAMDKFATRAIVSGAGVDVAWATRWQPGQNLPRDVRFPVVVKPNRQGSSVGLSLVNSEEELPAALVSASAGVGEEALIEQYIPGDEWTVAVFNGHAFPPLHIQHQSPLFDHEAKYASTQSRVTPLTDAADSRFDRLRNAGLVAYAATGLSGLARADFIWNEGRPYFLEINAIPGMTARSLAPVAAAAAGIDFQQLCLAMLADAIRQAE